ncbi:UNVERIFIED_CONTAM: Bifunctional 3-dehydroquinate dehydratase/shikimate dehydrogenase, chloroplastic [Sesamum angustifolium]|uniref:Bifunctional 3-dehydroquinate dehydratase/shikimate dehydrogenase, chloroplastic n=1 Tax=Sesamum angustifolium TaxID=2727405 RepID=A0AAW2RIT8_9LAMI
MICAPLMAESVEQMLSDMHQAKMEGADVVEIRLGCISDFQPHRDLKLLLENKPLPVVVVYGPTWEGGEYEGDEQERLQALLLAKDLGADYIELELKETLRDYKLVIDAVYTPRKTRLLKEAEAAGAIVVSGVEMFLRQATAQFSLFTGHKGLKFSHAQILSLM